MIKFEEISFRYGVPPHVKAHIKKLFAGNRRECGTTIIIEHFLTDYDKETIKRIIEYTHISEWEKLAKILPNTAEQVRFFDAVWITRIDYNQFRYRRGQAGETLKIEIRGKQKEIEDKVQELRELIAGHNRLVGGAAFRAHLGIPELEEALNGLLWEIRTHDKTQVHAEGFVCAAIKSREKSPKREYLRAFLFVLKQNAFPFEKKGTESLILAFARQSYGEDITRDDVKDIIKEVKSG